MIRLSKLADYGMVLLGHMAKELSPTQHYDVAMPEKADMQAKRFAARSLAEVSKLPLPTVSKVLKALSRAGILIAHRGKAGGYSLAVLPKDLSVCDMVEAIDGPIALTTCSATAPDLCDVQEHCPTRANWFTINAKVRDALQELSLADLIQRRPTGFADSASAPKAGAGHNRLPLTH